MFEYKTLALSFKEQVELSKRTLFGIYKTDGVAVGVDTAQLDTLVNEQAADGWELVTYSPLTSTGHITFVVTFRKAQ